MREWVQALGPAVVLLLVLVPFWLLLILVGSAY